MFLTEKPLKRFPEKKKYIKRKLGDFVPAA